MIIYYIFQVTLLALLGMKGSIMIGVLFFPSLNSQQTLAKEHLFNNYAICWGPKFFIKSALQLAADYKESNGFLHH